MNLGDYDTEQEAAYAYNVAAVLLAPVTGEKVTVEDLNNGLHLTLVQARHVEDEVTTIIRRELGLPANYRFPSAAKAILAQTCDVVIPTP